jgi:hypothetical protein
MGILLTMVFFFSSTSTKRVGNYGVEVEEFENLALPALSVNLEKVIYLILQSYIRNRYGMFSQLIFVSLELDEFTQGSRHR